MFMSMVVDSPQVLEMSAKAPEAVFWLPDRPGDPGQLGLSDSSAGLPIAVLSLASLASLSGGCCASTKPANPVRTLITIADIFKECVIAITFHVLLRCSLLLTRPVRLPRSANANAQNGRFVQASETALGRLLRNRSA